MNIQERKIKILNNVKWNQQMNSRLYELKFTSIEDQ